MATVLRADECGRGRGTLLARLLDLEFWVIGRDVEHPEGTLLLQPGCERESPPTGSRRHSRYRRSVGATEVVLWSWGLYHAHQAAGLLLSRCEDAVAGAAGVDHRVPRAGRRPGLADAVLRDGAAA